MVKVFTVCLLLVYAFSATGASVHLHYCCGKLQHLTMENERATDHDDCTLCLNHHENKNHTSDCDDSQHCAADVQSHNHCQDIQVDAQKTTGDHLPSSDKNVLKIQSLELLVFTLIHVVGSPLDNHTLVYAANSPPHTKSTPLFVRYCTYRI